MAKTRSRPHTPNRNPHSEAHFRTLECRPDFPEAIGGLEGARALCQRFVTWYNTEHHHPGTGWHHPIHIHHGHAGAIPASRADVLLAAYHRNPERFICKHPEPNALPVAGCLNNLTIPEQEPPINPMNPGPPRLKES